MAELKRTLGLAECIFFGVGSILGAGIYMLLGKVAGLSGNFIWLSFSIASLTALFTAISYAELSAAFPKAGGEYIYVKQAFGKKAGVLLCMTICHHLHFRHLHNRESYRSRAEDSSERSGASISYSGQCQEHTHIQHPRDSRDAYSFGVQYFKPVADTSLCAERCL